jgi:L-ascorbate metabolism protein UlaG (beta-lactamase superfamily)
MMELAHYNFCCMKLTRLELNSWIIEIAGQVILVDPWLVDPMTFFGSPWLFKATHKGPQTYTPKTLPKVDLILLSQSFDDHCHKPTLEQLDHSIPVVASPAAAKIVRDLGYTHVISLTTWQKYGGANGLDITAMPSAPASSGGENGYLLKGGAESLYYEPHIFPANQAIASYISNLDVAIAPVVGQIFPLIGQVIMGPQEALSMVKTLRPRVVLSTGNGNVHIEGLLIKGVRPVGSFEEFAALLKASGLPTKFLTPQGGETVVLEKAAS